MNNNINLVVKKTNELTNSQKLELCYLFNDVFFKNFLLDDFNTKFVKNIKNYSYHSLLLNDASKIVGCYSAIPYEYNFFGKNLLFGLSVDTMIQEEYRGNPFTLKKLANAVYEEMKKDGVSFVFGFPNDNVYLVRKKILKWKDIGELDYYILPINLGAIKKKLNFLNFISNIYAKSINNFVREKLDINTQSKSIEKVNNKNYLPNRYDNSYNIVDIDSGFYVYKIYIEDDVRTAFIIDVYPLTKKTLELSTKKIYIAEKGNIDVILYVGKLDFKVKNLIKVPSKYEPKTVHMSGKILDDSVVDNRVFDIKNWNVNLSNYDVR